MKNVLAICGSLRTASTSERITQFITQQYRRQISVHPYRNLAQLPYFNPDLVTPPVVMDFLQQIEQADAVLIVSPEYVFSVPGVLKNALEWTVATTVFANKPVALITAATNGEYAHKSLTLIMQTLGGLLGESSTLLIKGARSKLNDQGDVIDEEARQNIQALIEALI